MSLRVQTASQNHESRPWPRDTKIKDESNRWDSILGITHYCRYNHNSGNCDCIQQHNRDRTESNNSEFSIMTSSSYSSTMIPDVPSSTRQYHGSSPIQIDENTINYSPRHASSPSVATPSVDAPNVMQWMQNDCPKDVVPLILAFAGPQKIATIRKTSRFWRQVMDQEETWSRLCESLYKVRRMMGKGMVYVHFYGNFVLTTFALPLLFAIVSSVERGRRHSPVLESILYLQPVCPSRLFNHSHRNQESDCICKQRFLETKRNSNSTSPWTL